MKITQDVRDFAKENGIESDNEAIEKGLQEQAELFKKQGGELYF